MKTLTMELPDLTPQEADRAYLLVAELLDALWDTYEPELLSIILAPEPPEPPASLSDTPDDIPW